MNFIKLYDVKIKKEFLESNVSERKVNKAKKYIRQNGHVDEPIILNGGVLVDGYTRFLAAYQMGWKWIPYVELEHISYIIGKFDGSNKSYIWKNDRYVDISIGDKVIVKSKHNNSCVTVIGMFKHNDIDLYRQHKSVIRLAN